MKDKIILKPKEEKTVTFSIRVNKELLSKFDSLSNESGFSRNELIKFAMEYYINNVELEKNKKIE